MLLLLVTAAGFAQEPVALPETTQPREQRRQVNEAISIKANFNGSKVIVEKIEGHVVTLQPDLRGDRDWFYWPFECQTSEWRKLRFVLPDTRSMKFTGMQGPAISRDGGQTWKWTGAESVDGPAFECAFEPGKPLRLAVTIPYMQSNLDRLLQEHADNEQLTVGELTKPRGGLPVELLQIGQPGVAVRVNKAAWHTTPESAGRAIQRSRQHSSGR